MINHPQRSPLEDVEEDEFSYDDHYSFQDREIPAHRAFLAGLLPYVLAPLRWAFWWIQSRHLRIALAATPAVAVLLSAAVVFVEARRISAGDLAERYRVAAAAALKAEDSESAQLWLEESIQLKPDQAESQYALARMWLESGQQLKAAALMNQLAPEDSEGFPAAHLWVAEELNANKDAATGRKLELLSHHLAIAAEDAQLATDAHSLMGAVLLRSGDREAAIEHLEAAAAEDPRLWVAVAGVYRNMGRESNAMLAYGRALKFHRRKTIQDTTDDEARLDWATCHILRREYTEAERILRAGLRHSEHSGYRQRLAGIYLIQFDKLWEQDGLDAARALELLDGAARLLPNDPEVIARFSRLAASSGDSKERVRKRLVASVVEGRATASVHFALGAMAAAENEHQRALSHYQLSARMRKPGWALLNNMAYSTARVEPVDLEAALTLAYRAVAQSQQHPEALDTRADILLRAERWQEAISDYEKILPNSTRKPEVHRALAVAYRAIGNEALALAHEQTVAKEPGTDTDR